LRYKYAKYCSALKEVSLLEKQGMLFSFISKYLEKNSIIWLGEFIWYKRRAQFENKILHTHFSTQTLVRVRINGPWTS